MATILKNILSFTGLVVGVPVALPHRLNVNGISVLPKTVEPDIGGFTITANSTTVTVTRGASAPDAVNVLVEYWHSIEAVVPLVPPPGKLVGQVPWIQQPGGGGSGGGSTYAFVFQPGGTPGANVFDDWTQLNTAMAAVRGPKLLQFDDQFAAISIPVGTWDMTDTVWEGVDKNFLDAPTTVTFEDGAVVEKLRTVRGLYLICAGAPAINDIADNDVFTFEDYAVMGGDNNAIIDLSGVVKGNVIFSIRHGAQVRSQQPPITNMNVGIIVDVDSMSQFEGQSVIGTGVVRIRPASLNKDTTVLQDLAGGVIVQNRLGGFNLQGNSGYQLFPGIVEYWTTNGAEIASLTPASWNPGGCFVVKHAGTGGTVTVTPSGVETIDGNPNHVLNPGGSVIMVSDGVSNYMIIGEKI